MAIHRICSILFVFLAAFLPLCASANWKASFKTDEMTDEKIGITSSQAINTVPGSISNVRPQVVLRCSDTGGIELIVDWQQYLNSTDSLPITLRFDSMESQNFKTSASTEGSAQFVQSQGVVIPMMIEHVTLRAQTRNYNGTSTGVARFNLVGFTTAFRNACSWHYDYQDIAGLMQESKPQSSGEIVGLRTYMQEISNHIKSNWRKPLNFRNNSCEVGIKQDRSGVVRRVNVECNVQNNTILRSLENAVLKSSPLPLPKNIELFDSNLKVKIGN